MTKQYILNTDFTAIIEDAEDYFEDFYFEWKNFEGSLTEFSKLHDISYADAIENITLGSEINKVREG